jgi:hypothetical protein
VATAEASPVRPPAHDLSVVNAAPRAPLSAPRENPRVRSERSNRTRSPTPLVDEPEVQVAPDQARALVRFLAGVRAGRTMAGPSTFTNGAVVVEPVPVPAPVVIPELPVPSDPAPIASES